MWTANSFIAISNTNVLHCVLKTIDSNSEMKLNKCYIHFSPGALRQRHHWALHTRRPLENPRDLKAVLFTYLWSAKWVVLFLRFYVSS